MRLPSDRFITEKQLLTLYLIRSLITVPFEVQKSSFMDGESADPFYVHLHCFKVFKLFSFYAGVWCGLWYLAYDGPHHKWVIYHLSLKVRNFVNSCFWGNYTKCKPEKNRFIIITRPFPLRTGFSSPSPNDVLLLLKAPPHSLSHSSNHNSLQREVSLMHSRTHQLDVC